jgi:hypothetical protein
VTSGRFSSVAASQSTTRTKPAIVYVWTRFSTDLCCTAWPLGRPGDGTGGGYRPFAAHPVRIPIPVPVALIGSSQVLHEVGGGAVSREADFSRCTWPGLRLADRNSALVGHRATFCCVSQPEWISRSTASIPGTPPPLGLYHTHTFAQAQLPVRPTGTWAMAAQPLIPASSTWSGTSVQAGLSVVNASLLEAVENHNE